MKFTNALVYAAYTKFEKQRKLSPGVLVVRTDLQMVTEPELS